MHTTHTVKHEGSSKTTQKHKKKYPPGIEPENRAEIGAKPRFLSRMRDALGGRQRGYFATKS